MGRKLDSASGPLGVGPPPRYVTVASYVISLEPDGLFLQSFSVLRVLQICLLSSLKDRTDASYSHRKVYKN